MTIDEALTIATDFLAKKMPQSSRGDLFIVDDKDVMEEDDGWYFLYQTDTFIITNDLKTSVVGNSPIFVSKNGDVGFRMFGMPFHPVV